MITLHEVYERGSVSVKAAVLSFGARHLHDAASGPEPDWKTAERHFTCLIERIMGNTMPQQPGVAAIVRQAERHAVDFLLAVNNHPDYRCPMCVTRQLPPL